MKEAGMTVEQALRGRFALDKRRRSVHSENVELLKAQLQSLTPPKRRVPKSRKTKKG